MNNAEAIHIAEEQAAKDRGLLASLQGRDAAKVSPAPALYKPNRHERRNLLRLARKSPSRGGARRPWYPREA